MASVESLTASLVREYLHRKKCVNTLCELDLEFPRDESSISNRTKLAADLNMQQIVQQNKCKSKPYKTMLEMMISNYLCGKQDDIIIENHSTQNKHSKDELNNQPNKTLHFKTTSAVPVTSAIAPVNPNIVISSKSTNSLHQQNVSSFSPTLYEKAQNNENVVIEKPRPVVRPASARTYSPVKKMITRPHSVQAQHRDTGDDKLNNVLDLLSLSDVTDDETIPNNKVALYRDPLTPPSTPLTLFDAEIALQLRKLFFGVTKFGFSSEWVNQNFSFCNCVNGEPSELRFGIVQKKGGPCGVLAAVQAVVLKHLIFGDNKIFYADHLNVSDKARTRCLISALAEIIWRAKCGNVAYLALLSIRQQFTLPHGCKLDGLTEYVTLQSFSSFERLKSCIESNIQSYENGKGSCILLLYSCVLSHGVERIVQDMDDKGGHIMGAHGYCTQEMINLLLIGQATSNAFDNEIKLDGGHTLRGIPVQSDIGMLSLFEHYGSCQIGNNYKSPKFPIWLVCSESHFSVIFSLNKSSNSEQEFDLYYYDGLANQDEVIKLTVRLDVYDQLPQEQLIPPIDHCIRTKWPNACVDWNDTEPIL